MKTRVLIVAPVALGLPGAGAWLALRDAPEAALDPTMPVMPTTVDIVQGQALYAESCASCHGANLEGRPNWQTPVRMAVCPHHPIMKPATPGTTLIGFCVNIRSSVPGKPWRCKGWTSTAACPPSAMS